MAKNNDRNRQSLRRNPIDNLSDKKKKDSDTREIINNLAKIETKLDDVVAGEELNSEVTHKGFSELSEKLSDKISEGNATLDDLVHGIDLMTEDSSIQLRELNKTATIISNKLSNIYKAMGGASGARPPKVNNPEEGGESTKPTEDFVGPVKPNPPTPTEDFVGPVKPNPANPPDTPTPDREEERRRRRRRPEPIIVSRRKRKDDTKKRKGKSNTEKILSDGFGGLLKTGSTISSFLFDISVAVALNVAKTILLISAVVFAFDVIRMKFEYYAKLLDTNFKAFQEKLGEIAPLIMDIIDTVQKVQNALTKLDFMSAAKFLVVGLAKVIKDILFGIQFSLAKMTASIIRALSFGHDAFADNYEGAAAVEYQFGTNSILNSDDAKKAGRFIQNRDELARKMKNAAHGYGDEDQSANPPQTNRSGQAYISAPDYMSIKDDDTRYSLIGGMQNDEYEADNATKRIQDQVSDGVSSGVIKANMKDEVDKMNSKYSSLQKQSKDAAADIKPNIDKMNKAYNSLQDSKASAENPKNSTTAAQEKNINNLSSQGNNKGGGNKDASSNLNVANVKNVNNTTVNKFDAKTSSPAPGMGGARRVQ